MLAKQEISGIIIAGSGKFGRFLAHKMSRAAEAVVIIDIDAGALAQLPSDCPITAVEGDASNIEVLRYAGIARSRAVIATTDQDSINLMIASIASEIYDVPEVVAIVSDSNRIPDREQCHFKIICPMLTVADTVLDSIQPQGR